jgi:hypothetical protein
MRASAHAQGARAYPNPLGDAKSGSALGSSIATHNPDPEASAETPLPGGGLLNVNTAPRSLLVAALRVAGSSGLDEILRARERGEPAPVPANRAGTEERGAGGSNPVAGAWSMRLVGQSDAWAFRVDVEYGTVRRSWWCVYRAAGSEWRCVQRVAITD